MLLANNSYSKLKYKYQLIVKLKSFLNTIRNYPVIYLLILSLKYLNSDF